MYCSRCGVEVDEGVEKCPLCEAPIQKLPADDKSPWPKDVAPSPSSPPMSPDERKALARTLTTLGFLIPAAIVLTVDWFINRRLSWSVFALISLGAVWMWSLIPLVFNRKPYLLIFSITAVSIAAMSGIGILSGHSGWILPIGIPVVVTAGFLGAGVTALTKSAKKIGGNLAAWILQALALLCIVSDILISSRINGTLRPGWSIVAASTLLPVSILLLYLHYRPSTQQKLRRYFHV